MSMLFKAAAAVDRMGFRRPLAIVTSAFYPASRFSVHQSGYWVNAQPGATFVSTSLHTKSFAAVERWVLDNWCWDYLPGPGDTIIDVGAGIGEEAVIFSKLVGRAGRVVSIEAHPATFACLEGTVAASGLTNVTALHCAVADEDGELRIDTHDNHLASSVLSGGETIVPARALDSIAEELGLDHVAQLKMNIEGAEKLAVRGMTKLMDRLQHAVISCHDFIADDGGSDFYRSREAVRPGLESAGFTIRTRPDAAEPWVRDYLYARRP